MKLSLEHINTVRKGGKVYHYHRKTGKRIEGEPGTLAFFASYEEASKADVSDAGETLSSLLLAYEKSSDFAALATTTKALYRRYLFLIREKFGNVGLVAFNDKRIRGVVHEWRDSIALGSKVAADHSVKTLNVVLNFGEERGVIERNHIAKTRSLYQSDRSEKTWEPGQVAALLKAASPEMSWAIRLALLTGQRSADLLKWKWADYDGKVLRLRQQKTAGQVTLPASGALGAFLDTLPRRASTILTSTTGRPWNAGWFRDRWRATKDAAGLGDLDLHFHDLRGTAITALADAGCTEAQIAAITGHSLSTVGAMLRKYLRRTEAQAKAGSLAIGNSWIGQLQTDVPNAKLTD